VNVAGQREHRTRRGRPGFAALRSRLAAVVAALALVVQLVALPYHQALTAPVAAPVASDLASAAAELKATFGEAAALCVQSDEKGKPTAPGDCDDHCPLCQFRAQAAALVAPDLPALPARVAGARRTLGPLPEASAPPSRPAFRIRARAPPLAI